MALVAIEEQHLMDIGDALRDKFGKTEKDTYLAIACTTGATGFDKLGDYTVVTTTTIPVVIPGAHTLKIKMTYQFGYNEANLNYIKIFPGVVDVFDGETIYSDTIGTGTVSKTINLEYIGDSITIRFEKNTDVSWHKGFYAEIIGYDTENNPVAFQYKYKPREMASAIESMPPVPPEEAFVIANDCYYRFYKGGWDWFIDKYCDKITTKDISDASSMFALGKLTEIPFVFNMKQDAAKLSNCFSSCNNLKVAPTIKLNLVKPTYSNVDFSNLIYNCPYIRDAENMFDPNELEILSTIKVTSGYSCPRYGGVLDTCSSLRSVPSWWYKFKVSEESTAHPNNSYWIYYNTFNTCYALDEINNIPVQVTRGAMTSNLFNRTFIKCSRVKNMTFETNEDKTPKIVQWKSQTIELDNYFGYAQYQSNITSYNSGITKDKEVGVFWDSVTEETHSNYDELKDDPDWWTCNIDYSRYNHDSAVATINSLPDTSAYLATAGGTNTIKFKGAAGSKTDGGAINTLTEEEIAVATAKGWTVTLT